MAALLVSGSFVQGQGTVDFENTAFTPISTNSMPGGPPTGALSGVPATYYFALFSAPTGTVDPSQFSFTGDYATNTVRLGRIYGGSPPIPGTQPGEYYSLLVRGWSANIGPDYSSVTSYLAAPTITAWYGESQIATVLLGGDFPPPQTLFGSNPGQIPGFTLNMHVATPEPESLALLGLGEVLLWRNCRVLRRDPELTK